MPPPGPDLKPERAFTASLGRAIQMVCPAGRRVKPELSAGLSLFTKNALFGGPSSSLLMTLGLKASEVFWPALDHNLSAEATAAGMVLGQSTILTP
jgi:hypothetical protein